MDFKKWLALATCACALMGCGGGVNLYAQPAADFERAVDITAALTQDFEGLERRLLKSAQTDAVTSDPAVKLNFKPTQCAVGDPGTGCVIVNRTSGKPVLDAITMVTKGVTRGVSGTDGAKQSLGAMVGKLKHYASVLSSIAQAGTKSELQTANAQTSSTYDALYSSLTDMNRTELKAEAEDFKSSAVDALASMYVESERIKVLLALVEQGEPIVTAVSDTLGRFVGDIQSDYVSNQKDRVMQLVLTYNVISSGATPQATASGLALKALRQDTLKRALGEQIALQAVMSVNAKAAFGKMKAAHTALLAALRLADSSQGKAQVAIAQLTEAVSSFTQAAMGASKTMNALKGLM